MNGLDIVLCYVTCINKTLFLIIQFYPVFYPVLSGFIQLYLVFSRFNRFYPVLSGFIKFYPVWSSFIRFFQFSPVFSSFIRFDPVLTGFIQFHPVLSRFIRFYPDLFFIQFYLEQLSVLGIALHRFDGGSFSSTTASDASLLLDRIVLSESFCSFPFHIFLLSRMISLLFLINIELIIHYINID